MYQYVYGTYNCVEAREAPIGIDESHNKCNTRRFPARVIDESGENKLRILMCRRFCGYRDEDHRKRNKRGV